MRVEGAVDRVPAEESDAYFATRPPGAQAGAVVSRQSEVLASRGELEARVAELDAAEVARPETWGGFRLVPRGVGVLAAPRRPSARPLSLPREGDTWVIERLYP